MIIVSLLRSFAKGRLFSIKNKHNLTSNKFKQTGQYVDDYDIVQDKQPIDIETEYESALHKWLDTTFPTDDILNKLHCDGKKLFRLILHTTGYLPNVIINNITIPRDDSWYIPLNGMKFKLNFDYCSNPKAFDIKNNTVSFNYIKQYLSHKTPPTLGLGRLQKSSNRLYYIW